MDKGVEKILESLKGKRVGVFVDDSNLYHAYQKYGWRIDIGKFKELLTHHCEVEFINYYVAIPEKDDAMFHKTQKFLEKIKPHVSLRTKPLKYMPAGGRVIKKADVDVEITLDVVRKIDNVDIAIILSGDSDLLELKNYVVYEKKKSILFVSYEENMAWELRQCWHLYLNRIKDEIALKR